MDSFPSRPPDDFSGLPFSVSRAYFPRVLIRLIDSYFPDVIGGYHGKVDSTSTTTSRHPIRFPIRTGNPIVEFHFAVRRIG